MAPNRYQQLQRKATQSQRRDNVLAAAGFDMSAECEVCDGDGEVPNGVPGEPPLQCYYCEGYGVIPMEGILPR
jgi:DnaJ-class molecular chaperone